MKICVMGLGYIGLPTAVMFASYGNNVIGVDVKPEIIEMLNNGKLHIEEPGLEDLLKESVKKKKFKAISEPDKADVFMITVPTPNLDDLYMSCDLTYVLDACRAIIPHLRSGNTVIIESTIAPRSMDDYIGPLFQAAGYKIGEDIFLAHCPERVLPGQILTELVYNNRIVGGLTSNCTEAAAKVYAQFVKGEIIKTEAKTAEMSKCMENTFRDVNIALANELTKVCYDLKINVLDVIDMANKHPRVNIHSPGPGVGGHCLAVDPYFISAKSPDNSKIIQLARETNSGMPTFVVDVVKKLLESIENPKIAILGMAYKGNVDDMRESPALKVAQILEQWECEIAIHDPHIRLESFLSFEDAITGADLILVLTDHNEFKELDEFVIVNRMRTPQIFDTKNIIRLKESVGIEVYNFGNINDRNITRRYEHISSS
ncbi:nucleotide sugar dehydrogenase [Paenibacillus chungangensis]|uniref:Nucleotide sugar dehydrogenase n=1 Tax=Paenibacillus chungangensis TaxID=696535 RepID=A0ABW3HWF5_9BACL